MIGRERAAGVSACSVDGCTQVHKARGYCDTHYSYLIRTMPGFTGRKCSLEDCARPHYGHGFCHKHWNRQRSHGDPHVVKRRMRATVTERLGQFTQESSGCLVWTGSLDKDGYGKVRLHGKQVRAHRAVYEEAHGAIPGGLVVRHKCDNRPCVKLDHLETGTPRQNTLDSVDRGRWTFGERNGSARLTNDQASEIYRRVRAGEMQKGLAREFGVSKTTISRIALGQAWATATGAHRG